MVLYEKKSFKKNITEGWQAAVITNTKECLTNTAGNATESTVSGFKLKWDRCKRLKQMHESKITHTWFPYLCWHFLLSFVGGWKKAFLTKRMEKQHDAALLSLTCLSFASEERLWITQLVSWPTQHLFKSLGIYPLETLKCNNIFTHNTALPSLVISYSGNPMLFSSWCHYGSS